VEVFGQDDVKLLVRSGTVDWSEAADGESLAILWALENKEENAEALAKVNKINFQGNPSCDMTIVCGSETFRVHKLFLKKSPVFEAALSDSWAEARQKVLNLKEDSPEAVRKMIHFLYTGKIPEGVVDVYSVAYLAEKYALAGMMTALYWSLEDGDMEVTAEQVADMMLASSNLSSAGELRQLAIAKIKARPEILDNKNFREQVPGHDSLFDLIKEIVK